MYFEVCEKNEFSDFYNSRKHYPWKLFRINRTLYLIFGSIIFLFLTILVTMFNYVVFTMWYALIFLFLIGVWSVLKPVLDAASVSRTFKRIHGADTDTIYRFAEDELVVTTGNTVRTLKYTDFGDVTEDDEYFFLWITTQQIYTLPKKYFVKGDVGEFVNFIRPRISKHLTKDPIATSAIINLIISVGGILVIVWQLCRFALFYFGNTMGI